MSNIVKLTANRQDKTLIAYGGSVSSIPPLFQTNMQDLRVQIVDPQSATLFNQSFSIVDGSTWALRVVVAKEATGTPGDETANLLAATYEAGWTWDAGNQWFTGSIDFNTAEVQQWMGDDAFKTAILEINALIGGIPVTLYQGNITVKANCDTGQSQAPSVLTQAQVVGTKVIQNGVGGVTIVDNVVTVAGLGLAQTPANVFLWMQAPAGSGFIGCDFVIGSASTAGFSFVMSGIPENNNYKIQYVITF